MMRSTRAPDAHARRPAILSEGSYAAAPIAVLSFAPQMTEPDAVRLDKWLWAARFFKTRSLATAAIELGRVRRAGERVKPAHAVRLGERYEIQQGDCRIDVVVLGLSAVRGPAPSARALYQETTDSVLRRQRRAELRRFGAEPAQDIRGRPTKRDGRRLRDLPSD